MVYLLNSQSAQKKCRKLKCRLGKLAFLLNNRFYPLYFKCQSRIIKYDIGKINTHNNEWLKVKPLKCRINEMFTRSMLIRLFFCKKYKFYPQIGNEKIVGILVTH